MIISKIKTIELLIILKEIINRANYINAREQKKILFMHEKMSKKAQYNLILNPELILYIKNISSFMQDAKSVYITEVNNRLYLYLYYRVLNSYYEHIVDDEEKHQFSNIEINICCKEVSKDTKYSISIQEIVQSGLFLIGKSKNNTVTIDLKKIDSCHKGKPTEIAKYAKKSVIATLLGYKIENSFRKNPDCKNRIVGLSELKAKHLDIADRQIKVNCPICNKAFTITKKNIEHIITVKNNLVLLKCDHLNTKYIKEYPYSTDLSEYFEGYKPVDIIKKMFFLNNFVKITQKSSR